VLRRELKARVHAHRADDILTAIRIAEEFGFELAIEHATEGYKIAGILAEKKVPVVVGPILFSRTKYELRGMTPRNPGLLARAGVKVAIQTDEASATRYLAINAALAVREGMPEEEPCEPSPSTPPRSSAWPTAWAAWSRARTPTSSSSAVTRSTTARWRRW